MKKLLVLILIVLIIKVLADNRREHDLLWISVNTLRRKLRPIDSVEFGL